jgi:hypothetical protein
MLTDDPAPHSNHLQQRALLAFFSNLLVVLSSSLASLVMRWFPVVPRR